MPTGTHNPGLGIWSPYSKPVEIYGPRNGKASTLVVKLLRNTEERSLS